MVGKWQGSGGKWLGSRWEVAVAWQGSGGKWGEVGGSGGKWQEVVGSGWQWREVAEVAGSGGKWLGSGGKWQSLPPEKSPPSAHHRTPAKLEFTGRLTTGNHTNN